MLTEADILTALRDCFDPEVKLNLVDLGLIYAVATCPDPHSTPAWPRQRVKVSMTLTTPRCPASGLILEYGTGSRCATGWPASGISLASRSNWSGSPNGRPTASARRAAVSWGYKHRA